MSGAVGAGLSVLVLRPEPDATRTARAAAEAGFTPAIAPLFEIIDTGEAPPTGPFAALAAASAQGAARLARLPSDIPRATPVFAVGAQTARIAGEAGFAELHIADGDRHALAELLLATLPAGAPVLLALGRDRHEDWIERLAGGGLKPIIWTCYEARAVAALPEPAAIALAAGGPVSALHFSRRGAETFLALAEKAGLAPVATAARHIALSADVAAPLLAAGAGNVTVADAPNHHALMAALRNANAEMADRAGVASGFVAKIASQARPGQKRPGQTGSAQEETDGVAGKRKQMGGTEGGTAEDVSVPAAGPQPAEMATATATTSDAPTHMHAATPAAEQPGPQPEPTVEAPSAPVPAPMRHGPGWGGLIVAGLIGGVIGAGGVYELQKYLPDVASSAAQQVPALEARLKTLEAAQSSLAPRSDVQALAGRAAEAANELGRLRQDIAAASQRAEAVAARPSASPAAATSAEPAAIPAELAARLARAETAATEASGALKAALPRIDALEAGLKPLAAARNPNAAAAQLLLIERIRRALDAGTRFEGDVAALAATGLAPAALAPLQALAAAGAPTREALRAELRKHRRAMAEENTAQPEGWREQALRLAGRIVSVQRVDGSAAETPAALTERIDAALAAGDFTAAAAAWRALPEPARRASEPLGKGLSAREAALAALAALGDTAIKALGARQE